MKVVYILTSDQTAPLEDEALREALQSEGTSVTLTGGGGFRLEADSAIVEGSFEPTPLSLKGTLDLVTGSDAAQERFRAAQGVWRLSIEPGHPHPTMAVFEALWCAHSLLQHVNGVLLDLSAFKLHEAADLDEICELEFDIRDHVNLHAVEADDEGRLWIHSHGMEKFGILNVEAFHVQEADLKAAESFFHQLLTDLAMGQGPPAGTPIETGEGDSFQLIPSDEARPKLMGMDPKIFEGHEGPFLTLVSLSGRHTVAQMLEPYREHFEGETDELREALLNQAQQFLPAFKSRFFRRGLMEPLTFLVRAPFETHPEQEPQAEHLWAEVLDWGEGALTGKLIDGSTQTTEWRKGVQVEISEEQVNALAIARGGRPLDDGEFSQMLSLERPS